MITVAVYLWAGSRSYTCEHVNLLARQVLRHLPGARFVCVTDCHGDFSDQVEVVAPPKEEWRKLTRLRTPEGYGFPSSYPRLLTLSPWAKCLGKKVLVLDVDCLVAGSLEPLASRDGDFIGWRSSSKWGRWPRLGGGTWMHKPGTLEHLWNKFYAHPRQEIHLARMAGYRGSDQALLSYWLASSVPYWTAEDGIYQMQDGVESWSEIPENARIVHMNGSKVKPWNCPYSWAQEVVHED